jgi:hypothetical protein
MNRSSHFEEIFLVTAVRFATDHDVSRHSGNEGRACRPDEHFRVLSSHKPEPIATVFNTEQTGIFSLAIVFGSRAQPPYLQLPYD